MVIEYTLIAVFVTMTGYNSRTNFTPVALGTYADLQLCQSAGKVVIESLSARSKAFCVLSKGIPSK